MRMHRYVVRRLVDAVPTLIGITLIVFLLIHLIPGDAAATLLGPRASPARVRALDHVLGLDRSLPAQYWSFLTGLFHGNLGQSTYYRTATGPLIFGHLGVTLWLLVYAGLLSLLIAVPLAVLAARNQGRWLDQAVRVLPMLTFGMPVFWVGIVLLLIFGLDLSLFPVGGFGTGFFGHVRSMFLPSLTVALGIAPLLIRNLRSAMLQVLDSDFVAVARAKGLSERRIITGHVLRVAVISTVTIFGLNLAWLAGGALVIEEVFGLPGIGKLMVDAIFQRDVSVVQAVKLVFAFLVVLINLLTDLVHSLLDPRIRLQ